MSHFSKRYFLIFFIQAVFRHKRKGLAMNRYRLLPLVIFILCSSPIISEEKNQVIQLPDIVITATKEKTEKAKSTHSVSGIAEEEIQSVSASHPAELLNRRSGVHINNLGGESHMTAIRGPITTTGMYLFLENNLPTRPSGFFNHNALYEINVPQAAMVEITKGPGSALYGSDSIGGIINIFTKPAGDKRTLSLHPEIGSFKWNRILLSATDRLDFLDTGLRLDLNITDTGGYRENSDFSRVSSTLQFDQFLSNSLQSSTVLAYTTVDQSGISTLKINDYTNNPSKNLYSGKIGYRDLSALRVSTAFELETDYLQKFSFMPFYRDNNLTMMPSWMITYDPNIRTTTFQSYGFQSKIRTKSSDSKNEFTIGLDLDYSPATYTEDQITVTKNGDIYTSHTATGTNLYDFTVKQMVLSPYTQYAWQASDTFQVVSGLRFDYYNINYATPLDSLSTNNFKKYYRPNSQTIKHRHLSPKTGFTYRYRPEINFFGNYGHSFRVPSISRLFRSGSTQNTDDLKPVKADNFELGMRGKTDGFSYEIAAYYMTKSDDIVTYIDGSDRKITNAGKTAHRGIEIEFQKLFGNEIKFRVATGLSQHTYEKFSYVYFSRTQFKNVEVYFDRNKVAFSPDYTAHIGMDYNPSWLSGLTASFGLNGIGPYFTDETNTNRYKGHYLLNIRLNYKISNQFKFYARIMNVLDQRYSVYTSNQVGDTDIAYRPGTPRHYFAGLKVDI
ncbi:TonB-dependent receptor [Candidatus Marinamargulisbacteria bacterium SCGC AAA071-K20]|nr:TonB-dependent receptor [Candidatus Marinamargulisbacteria bacterium SCGC AAA071-K20]